MAQAITDATLREAITERLQAVHVEARANPRPAPSPPTLRASHTGGCGQAFSTLIVSPRFQGLGSLKRHRLVNAALKDEIAAIHAWTARCQTPAEWERDAAGAAPAAGPSMAGTVDGRVDGTSG